MKNKTKIRKYYTLGTVNIFRPGLVCTVPYDVSILLNLRHKYKYNEKMKNKNKKKRILHFRNS